MADLKLEDWAKARGIDLDRHLEMLRSQDLRAIAKQLEAEHQRRMRKIDAEIRRRAADLLSEEPEPSPNGEKDDNQEPGLEGGTKNADKPGLE